MDAAKLYEMLVRYAGGETRVWRVVRVPTVEQEDARRVHRELERLKKERNAHVSRMRGLAVLHNVRLERIGGRGWAQHLEQLQGRLPAALWQEIARESRRLELVSTQIAAVERERQGQLEAMLEQGGPLAALMRLRESGCKVPGCWCASCLAGAALPTAASWPGAWA